MESIENLFAGVADGVNDTLGPWAGFLAEYVWGWPEQAPLLALILLGTGLFITLRMAFIQVRGFKHAIDITRGKFDDPEDEGDLNHFQALTTALSATVGIGNIAGVAIAIRMGGPGALFYMWITAFFGMALKYTECTLAVHHRKLNSDGSVSGGPMYYIEKGLGRNFKWMALIFAVCAAISSFGGGCMNQSNTLAVQVQSDFGIPTVYTSLLFATIVGIVIIGGIRRIGTVTSILAPAMATLYVAGAMLILLLNFSEIPGGFSTIIGNAFAPEPMIGGAAGSFIMTVMWGVRRGLFSNEAGQGSAPIAHATARTDEPVREGLVASLEPFIDTLVICTMTGLVIVLTGANGAKVEQTLDLSATTIVLEQVADEGLQDALASPGAAGSFEVSGGQPVGATPVTLGATVEQARFVDAEGRPWSGSIRVGADGVPATEGEPPGVVGLALLNGAPMTSHAFATGLPGNWGGLIVTIAVILFAVSTGISWSYYGDRAVEYVFGSSAIPVYRWVFIFFFFMGGILPLSAVWTFGDVALGLMTLPNLIALLLLSGSVAAMTRAYFAKDHSRDRALNR